MQGNFKAGERGREGIFNRKSVVGDLTIPTHLSNTKTVTHSVWESAATSIRTLSFPTDS